MSFIVRASGHIPKIAFTKEMNMHTHAPPSLAAIEDTHTKNLIDAGLGSA